MSAYIPALRRQRVVLAIGVVFAVLAAVTALYRVPSFELRDRPAYTATARLLVTGADAPYIRTSISKLATQEVVPGETARAQRGEVTRGGSAIIQNAPPDVTTYVRAANLYPILVESDQVKAEREARFGKLEGTVTANAIYQVSTPSRITLSEVPVIQVFGTSVSEQKAMDLTRHTAAAFVSWMTKQQVQAGIPPRQRIALQTIQQPRTAIASETSSMMIGVVVFAGVLFAFALLAIVVDRLKHPVKPADVEPIAPVAAAAQQPAAEAEETREAAAAGGRAGRWQRSQRPPSQPPRG